MKTIYHKAESRGHAEHGWLNTYHTFSFADYYNPDRIQFGALRVLNDDTVSGGMGFGKHPHQNMEIISIPLEGDLKHRDNLGNEGIIRIGEVQVMSAGTGIVHSEENANPDKLVRFLQIWIIPKNQNVDPRYDQISISDNVITNDFQQIVSPNKDDAGAWIHQDAWFHLASLETGISREYSVKKKGNGIYFFVIEGKAEINTQELNKRDGLGITEAEKINIKALKDTEILIMEIPMKLSE